METEHGPEYYRDDLRRAGVEAARLDEAAQHATIHGLRAAVELFAIPSERYRAALRERFGDAGEVGR